MSLGPGRIPLIRFAEASDSASVVSGSMEQAPAIAGGFGLVRRGPFARLWWASAISSLGDWVTLFATFSLATKIAGGGTGATVAILVPLVARILPGVLIGIVGGVLADRWDRKRTMWMADFGRAGLVFLLVFVTSFEQLFVLTFAIEVLSLLRQPAREALIPRLVAPGQLMAANGLGLLAAYGTAPVGSALFALIAQLSGALPDVGQFGTAVVAAFLFDTVTFTLSGLIVLFTPLPRTEVSAERTARGRLDLRAPLRDVADGFRFVAGSGPIRRVIVGMAVGLFGGGALFVLGQPFSEQVLGGGDTGYGILVTALGVGVGAGMALLTVLGRTITRREPLFATALAVTGLGILFTSFTSTVWGAAGWVFVAGLGTGTAYVSGFTHLHSTTSDEIRGRTFAALYAVARAALLVSFALAGVGAAALDGVLPGLFSSGTRLVMLAGGSIILLNGLGALWAVRRQLPWVPLDEHEYRAIRDAGEAVTWVRGDRRSRPE